MPTFLPQELIAGASAFSAKVANDAAAVVSLRVRNRLIDSFGESTKIDTSPHWIMAIVRQPFPVTFDRTSLQSIQIDPGLLGRNDAAPLIITDDCIGINISNSKASPLKQLSAVILQSDVNYLAHALPGDWVFAWIVNSDVVYNSLLRRLRNTNDIKPCNTLKDGLKFIGRIQSIRKQMSVDREVGTKKSSYTVNAQSFNELNSTLYYDPALAHQSILEGNLGDWLARVGLDVQDIFKVSLEGIDEPNVHKIIPSLLKIIVGRGVTNEINAGKTPELSAAVGAGASAPYAYIVPDLVAKILGLTDKEKALFSYADALTVLVGLQKYGNGNYLPDLAAIDGNHLYTPTPMLGTFFPSTAMNFTNQPLWGVLQGYLNPTVNEMYTCLRAGIGAGDDGRILPTLVVRQIPFTTPAFTNEFKRPETDYDKEVSREARRKNELRRKEEAEGEQKKSKSQEKHKKLTKAEEKEQARVEEEKHLEESRAGSKKEEARKDVPFTSFLELPVWVMSPILVNDVDIGRSDATRFNFVHVTGAAAYAANNYGQTEQIVENRPIRDDLDIMRSGLRPYITQVACAVVDQVSRVPSKWMALIADRIMGSHNTLNGTIVSVGIQDPVCEGDNLEFDGVTYHIEGVTHSCRIESGSGHKSFTTTFQLTNGMDSLGSTQYGAPLYPGTADEDNRQYDPGLTVDKGDKGSND